MKLNIIHFYTSSVLKDDCFQFLLLQLALHKPPLCASFCGGYQEERLLPNHSRERRTKLEVSLPVFRPHDKTAVIKTVWQWHKNRRIDRRDRTQHPEIKPHLHGHVILGKGGKKYTVGKDSLFNKWSRKLDSYLQNNQNCCSTFSYHIQK